MRKMIGFLVILLNGSLLAITADLTNPGPDEDVSGQKLPNLECSVPGDTTRWSIAYCMISGAYDGKSTLTENKCYRDTLAEDRKSYKQKESPCVTNLKRKTEICKILVKKKKVKHKNAEDCVHDRSYVPEYVREVPL